MSESAWVCNVCGHIELIKREHWFYGYADLSKKAKKRLLKSCRKTHEPDPVEQRKLGFFMTPDRKAAIEKLNATLIPVKVNPKWRPDE